MTDDISLTLSWFANFTNFYSIISVLIGFLLMVVFILRLNGENFMSSSATHYPVVREQSVVSLQNPLCVQLDSTKHSSLTAGLHLSVSLIRPCKMKVMWAVGVEAFQKELHLSSEHIMERFSDNKSFDGEFTHEVDCGILSHNGHQELHFKCPPGLTAETLGEPPRMMYPVSVVTVLDDRSDLQTTTIVLQMTIIHLKDNICSLDSHIVYQFVKTNTNKLLSLQPIFMTTTEPVTTNSNKVSSDSTQNSESSEVQEQQHANSSSRTCGQSLGGSHDTREHCTSCGRLEACSENIPSTRQHEMCDCPAQKKHEDSSYKTTDDVEDSENRNLDKGKTKDEMEQLKYNNLNSSSTGEEHHEEVEGLNLDNITDNMATEEIGGDDVQSESLETCCIVCQCSVIFYTLLPCRHACVCSTCIRQLDRCPICRSYIEAYFRLNSKCSELEARETTEDGDNLPRLNRWQAFNQRLNEMLGFV